MSTGFWTPLICCICLHWLLKSHGFCKIQSGIEGWIPLMATSYTITNQKTTKTAWSFWLQVDLTGLLFFTGVLLAIGVPLQQTFVKTHQSANMSSIVQYCCGRFVFSPFSLMFKNQLWRCYLLYVTSQVPEKAAKFCCAEVWKELIPMAISRTRFVWFFEHLRQFLFSKDEENFQQTDVFPPKAMNLDKGISPFPKVGYGNLFWRRLLFLP